MTLLCKVLLSSEEKAQALSIVTKEYTKSGYIQSEKEAIPSSKYLSESTSQTYGLFLEGKLIGTLSIIFDSENGIPMDSLFRDTLNSFRNKGEVLAEITQLAIDEEVFASFGLLKRNIERLRFLSTLFRAILQSAKNAQRSALCIMVNPKHDGFYHHIGFQSIDETKMYTHLHNAPAVPKILFLRDIEKQSMKNTLLARLLK